MSHVHRALAALVRICSVAGHAAPVNADTSSGKKQNWKTFEYEKCAGRAR